MGLKAYVKRYSKMYPPQKQTSGDQEYSLFTPKKREMLESYFSSIYYLSINRLTLSTRLWLKKFSAKLSLI